MDFSSNSWAYDIQPLVDHSTLHAYERLNNAAALTRAILTCDGESLLVRNSYCWKKDGLAILDAPQSMSMNQVCKRKGWKIVETYGHHLAIIAEEVSPCDPLTDSASLNQESAPFYRDSP